MGAHPKVYTRVQKQYKGYVVSVEITPIISGVTVGQSAAGSVRAILGLI